MKLRGQRVLARCDDAGNLTAEGGRVEIRYKANDGRAYFASARNLSPAGDERYPDSHCAPAERVAEKGKSGAKKSGGRAKKAKEPTVPPPNVPEGDEFLAYADGACSGNPGPAGLGVVMLSEEGRKELSEFLGRGTNNIAELTAIQRAAEAVTDPSRPLRVFTDSTYSIGVLQKGWKAKANRELIADVKAALARLDKWTLVYVKGHAGVPLNEAADQLAVAAVQSRATAGWRDA